MGGFNYGNKYRRGGYWAYKVGVFYAPKIKKWIVRINKKSSYTTIAQFDKKEDADECYKSELAV
ncbi:MAG: hypothetical protein AABY22_29975 [Nanoarchaeota archaeon]